MKKHTNPYIIILILFGGIYACTPATRPPLTDAEKRLPEHALDSMYIASDLKVGLFAHEPMLINPTNIDVDTKGRVWVCEGYNYRNPLNPGNPQKDEGDRILILEDTDQDGVADASKVFYQGPDVNSALGISVLGNKVYVSRSPFMFVFTDEDGDDLPDRKDTLFTEVEGVHHDHALHAVIFGPDGKLYFNFGNEGNFLRDKEGMPFYDRDGNAIEDNGQPYREGMIFRCNEDGSDVEILAHNFRNNYEVVVDSYGTLWQSDNDDDGNRGVRINYVMEHGNYGYKDEMTGEGWRAYRTGMAAEIPLRHWHQNDPGVVPNLLQTGAGSPTGMVFYEGTLLPSRYQNQMIHTDAGPRVVRAYPTQPAGAGYTAHQDTLMVSLGDLWFRPSDVCVAPDGSLIVADWYDPGVGGHKVGDLERGRLFRISPSNSPFNVPAQDYSTPKGATKALKSPNMATRYLAWKALEGMGKTAEAALLDMWEQEVPHLKARALWLLAKLEGKTSEYIDLALRSKNPDLRITGLRIAKLWNEDQLLTYCENLATDENPQVRREVALALRFEDSPEAAKIWTSLAQQYPEGDRWYLEALGIGADRHPELFFGSWLQAVGEDWKNGKNKDIVWRMRSSQAIEKLTDLIASEVEVNATHRYFRALDFHNPRKRQLALLKLLNKTEHPKFKDIRLLALTHLDAQTIGTSSLAKNALLEALPAIEDPVAYLQVLEKHMKALPPTAQEQESTRLQKLVLEGGENNIRVKALALLLDDPKGAQWVQQKVLEGSSLMRKEILEVLSLSQSQASFALLESLFENPRLALGDRQAAIQAYGQGWNGSRRLLKKLEENNLDSALILTAANQLVQSWDDRVSKVAAKYLPPAANAEVALPPLPELAAQTGDAMAGKQVFTKSCALCHQVGQEGVNFGPALTEIGNKLSKEALYSAILYPSAGISFTYEGYLVKTKDGSGYTGYIESESAASLTLRMNGGISQTLDKGQIDSMEELPVSLMPEGLHKGISQQDLVNLVEYLSGLKKAEALASNP